MEVDTHDLHDFNMFFFINREGTILRYVKATAETSELLDFSTFIGKSLRDVIPIFGEKALELVQHTSNTKTPVVYSKTIFNITCKATLLHLPCGNICALVHLN